MLSSKRSYSLLVPVMAAALVLIVSGCQKLGQQPARVAGDSTPGKNDPASKPTDTYTPEQRTYFTDIVKLPAYEEHLSPIFQKLNAAAWTASINAKKWLFVPQDLNADDTRNMAVHFLDGDDSALAIQTSNDVRVQKVLFASLNSKDQADFLLTEIMTSVYLYKNLNDTELCAAVKTVSAALPCPFLKKTASNVIQDNEDNSTDSDSQALDIQDAVTMNKTSAIPKKTPGPAPAPINDPRFGKKERLSMTDYNRIKLLVAYMKESDKDLTHKKIISKMTELGFDTRIFLVPFAPKAQEEVKETP